MTNFNEHIEYQERKADWQVYEDLYEGKKEVLLEKYLIKHEFEYTDNQLFSIRKERTEYTNFMAPFVSRFASLIFKRDQDYTRAMEVIFKGDAEKEFDNIDGEDTPLDLWLKRELSPCYFLYGKAGIYVDSPDIEVRSRREEIELGIRPYFHLWEPLSLIDWQYGSSKGRLRALDFAAYRYKLIEPRKKATEEITQNEYVKYLHLDGGRYTITTYKKEDKQYTEVSSKPTKLDEIPLTIVDRDSWMKDVAPKLRQLYNLESTLDNIQLFQAHQRIMAVGDFKAGEGGKYAAGAGNLLVLVSQNGGSIQIAEPADTTSLERRIEGVKADAVKIAFNQNRHLPGDSRDAESDKTLKEQKEEFRALAVNAAKDIEAMTNRSLYHYARMKGLNIEPEQFVTFDTDITEEDIDEFLNLTQVFEPRINLYPSWRKEVDKIGAKTMNLSNIEEVVKEINATPDEALQPQAEQDPLNDIFGNNGSQESADATPSEA